MPGNRYFKRLQPETAPSANLRIVVDARPTMAGIERYTHELCRLLLEEMGSDGLLFYGRSALGEYQPAPHASVQRRGLRPLLGSVKRIISDHLLLSLAAARFQADLIHSPNYFVPLCTNRPVVVTCHDASLETSFVGKKNGLMKYYERAMMRRGLRRAAHIIVLSRTVATILQQRFGIARERISPIYPPLPGFCTADMPLDPLAALIPVQGPFFLSVGTIEPRKNLPRLIQGWEKAYAQRPIPLVLVGPYGWRERALMAELRSRTTGIFWLGCVPEGELVQLYRSAIAVVQFSREEGFDYPVAEAICLGTPVVASDIPVHREVTAGHALFASPDDPQALAECLLAVSGWTREQRTAHIHQALTQVDRLRRESGARAYREVYVRAADASTSHCPG